MALLSILIQAGVRNLFARRINFVIGLIIAIGTVLLVAGGAVFESIDRTKSISIVESVSGHLQIYSADSSGQLKLFGGGEGDLAPIADFSKVKDWLLQVENVEAVVPMGMVQSQIFSQNLVDRALSRLRQAYNARDEGAPGAEALVADRERHVRRIVELIRDDFERSRAFLPDDPASLADQRAIERSTRDAFWSGFREDPYEALEFLENRLAPMWPEIDQVEVPLLGTNLEDFLRVFKRTRIVKGEAVPPGRRGILLSSLIYESRFKLRTAWRLDMIHKALTQEGRTIAGDFGLQHMVGQNQERTRELLLQLDDGAAQAIRGDLQQALGMKTAELPELLQALFATTDENFAERYRLFYDKVAPHLTLYRIAIGEMVPLKTFTRAGHVGVTQVPLYGTFQLEGLEDSPVAGSFNLIDLISFRALHGYPSPEHEAEVAELAAALGDGVIGRDQVEQSLFAAAGDQVQGVANTSIEVDGQLGLAAAGVREEVTRRVYTREELEGGMALNAAIFLKRPAELEQTRRQLHQLANDSGLGLRVVKWEDAAGWVGETLVVFRGMLYGAVFIIFLVVLLIMSNAMVLATLRRTAELGTIRAIGAGRRFVLALVFVEALSLTAASAALGALVGAGVIQYLNRVGIPATDQTLYFLFSGPRLHPELAAASLWTTVLAIGALSGLAMAYPAFLAMRVPPIRAMQAES